MLTYKDYMCQVDSLAIGSPSATLLSKGWMYKRDPRIKDEAKLVSHYMDSIIHNIKRDLK